MLFFSTLASCQMVSDSHDSDLFQVIEVDLLQLSVAEESFPLLIERRCKGDSLPL